jgi:hypothetical protein
VSPPWYGNRTCIGDRFSSSDYVHHVLSDGAPRLLTPAALDARTRIVANMRFPFGRAIPVTATAGLRQPLLVHEAGPLKNNDIRGTQTHVHESGGREPAVVCKTYLVPRGSSAVQQLAKRLPKPAGVSPPWFGNRAGKHRAFLAERGCSHATGGLRPPLLVVLRCGHSPAKLRLVQYTNARLQERRASARRGSVSVRACRAKRTIFGERRPPNQELRPSARRGMGIAPAAPSVCCRTRMLTCHGGLTPPALVLACECPPAK